MAEVRWWFEHTALSGALTASLGWTAAGELGWTQERQPHSDSLSGDESLRVLLGAAVLGAAVLGAAVLPGDASSFELASRRR